jgi:hypothetical protein
MKTFPVIVRKNHAHAGDQQVRFAVLIDVRNGHMGRPGDRIAQWRFRIDTARKLADPVDAVRGGVTNEDVGQTVSIEITNGDVGNDRVILHGQPDGLRHVVQDRPIFGRRRSVDCRFRGRRRLAEEHEHHHSDRHGGQKNQPGGQPGHPVCRRIG